MKINMNSSAKLAMTLITSMVAAIGTAAGNTMWQVFGKPKLFELTEKQQRPKQQIGFRID